MTIVFATCREKPDFTASDRLVADALARRGVEVEAAPWNGDEVAFERAALIVIRSTWDYYQHEEAFARWLDSLEGRAVANAPALMRWNMSKAYLEDMARRGARLPPMRRVGPSAAEIAAAMEALGLEEAIVKPLVGAGAHGLSVVRRDRPETLARAASALGGEGFVQRKMEAVMSAGETSFMFFGGAYSHAVVKRPKTGDLRVQEEHGGSTALTEPPRWAVDEAARLLEMIPEPADYARLDAVVVDGKLWLMEVEVLEPELFFTYAPEAAERFAEVLINRMK